MCWKRGIPPPSSALPAKTPVASRLVRMAAITRTPAPQGARRNSRFIQPSFSYKVDPCAIEYADTDPLGSAQRKTQALLTQDGNKEDASGRFLTRDMLVLGKRKIMAASSTARRIAAWG